MLRSVLAAALVLVAGCAAAQPDSRRSGQQMGARIMFELADRDRDGRVTLEEAWAFVGATFAAADADRDGALNRDELARFGPGGGSGRAPEAWREPVFRGLDANRDRRIQLEELRPVLEAFFRAQDANYDDALTRDEVPGAGS